MEETKTETAKVKETVEKALASWMVHPMVISVEQYLKTNYFLVKVDGNMSLGMLAAVSKAFDDDHLCVTSWLDGHLGMLIDGGRLEEDCEEEQPQTPTLPDDMRHRDRFPDAREVVIPGTRENRGHTVMCEQIKSWMKDTGDIPIVYLRLDDGVHIEVSDIYECKVRDILERGQAVGADGRHYMIEQPYNIYPVGSSICARATCIETGKSDIYGLDFFV